MNGRKQKTHTSRKSEAIKKVTQAKKKHHTDTRVTAAALPFTLHKVYYLNLNFLFCCSLYKDPVRLVTVLGIGDHAQTNQKHTVCPFPPKYTNKNAKVRKMHIVTINLLMICSYYYTRVNMVIANRLAR